MSFTFFRKYNKLILAVGGSLLMVIFLIPQASSFIGTKPNEVPVGSVGERQIVTGDLTQASAEMRVIRTIVMQAARMKQNQLQSANLPQNQRVALQQELQRVSAALGVLPAGQDPELTWTLLITEAEQQGLYASKVQGDELLRNWGVGEYLLSQLKSEMGLNDALLYRALRHYRMVLHLQRLAITPGFVSEPEIRHLARQTQTRIGVDLVRLDADRFTKDIADPTEEELRKRFQQNANDAAGRSEPYGFGYRRPSSVTFEFVAVPKELALAAVEVTEVEANRYYTQNPGAFMPDPADDADSDSDSDAPPFTLDPTQPKPYRQVRDEIFQTLRDRKAVELQSKIMQYITATLAESTRTWPRRDDGYRTPPDPADWLSMEQVAQGVQREFDLLPPVHRIDTPMPIKDINDVPGIGQAFVIFRDSPIEASLYMRSAIEFGPAASPLKLQVAMPSEVMVDRDRNLYLFRLTEVFPARPPLTLGEVVKEVSADVKKLKAYGELRRRSADYLTMARVDGLVTVAESVDPPIAVETIEPFAARMLNENPGTGQIEMVAPSLPVVGQSDQFIDELFKAAEPIFAAGGIDQVDKAQRYATIAVDKQLAVYVVEFTEFTPISAALVEMLRMPLAQTIIETQHRRMMVPATAPFTLEAIKQRVGYVPASDGSEEEDAPPTDEPADEPADPT